MEIHSLKNEIFKINSDEEFTNLALQIFKYQYANNSIYKLFVDNLGVNINDVSNVEQIPFLPIQFFKTHRITCGDTPEEAVFISSGTTQQQRSKHYILDLNLYEKSFSKGFEYFFGNISDYIIFGLLPSYLEQGNSSLVYMVEKLMLKTKTNFGGFYLNDFEKLKSDIEKVQNSGKKIMLFGVTYALLDMANTCPIKIKNAIIVETGGMKGRKEEIDREELHKVLKKSFGVDNIYSEYGMTELLSQAWSLKDGIFKTPPWMRVLLADTNDPLNVSAENKKGGINIIDLANINSCSFIATQDLGKMHPDNSFEVLGRFDSSDVRGCSLMYV